jgi:hypothetical protein
MTATIIQRTAFDFAPVRTRTRDVPPMVHRRNDELIEQVLRIKAWSRGEGWARR